MPSNSPMNAEYNKILLGFLLCMTTLFYGSFIFLAIYFLIDIVGNYLFGGLFPVIALPIGGILGLIGLWTLLLVDDYTSKVVRYITLSLLITGILSAILAFIFTFMMQIHFYLLWISFPFIIFATLKGIQKKIYPPNIDQK